MIGFNAVKLRKKYKQKGREEIQSEVDYTLKVERAELAKKRKKMEIDCDLKVKKIQSKMKHLLKEKDIQYQKIIDDKNKIIEKKNKYVSSVEKKMEYFKDIFAKAKYLGMKLSEESDTRLLAEASKNARANTLARELTDLSEENDKKTIKLLKPIEKFKRHEAGS